MDTLHNIITQLRYRYANKLVACLQKQRFSVDLSIYETGIYYVQIITNQGTETIKLQKVE